MSVFLSFIFVSAQEKTKSIFDVARSGTVSEVKELMKQNPDIINQTNESGFSPLILACYRGNTAVAEFLMKNVVITIATTNNNTTSVLSLFDKEEILKLMYSVTKSFKFPIPV